MITLAVIAVWCAAGKLVAGTLVQSEIDGLRLLAQHFPSLTNSSLGSMSWTNWSSPCSFYGISCSTIGQSVVLITIDDRWGADNMSDVLPSLAPYFQRPWTLDLTVLNVSTEVQSSLFIGTLLSLSFYNTPIPEVGDFSNLTGAAQLSFQTLPNLASIPSLRNLSALNSFSVFSCPSLSSLPPEWPNSTTSWLITVVSTQKVAIFPSLELASNLTSLTIQFTAIMDLSLLPSSSYSLLNTLNVQCLSFLQSFPANLSNFHLSTLIVTSCPKLPSNMMPILNPSSLTTLKINFQGITTLPDWICGMTHVAASLDLSYNSLTNLSECLGSLNLGSLFLSQAGANLSWIPIGVFSMPNLNLLYLSGLPSLIVNQTLTSTEWNLPKLYSLSIPSSYVAAGVPPPGSNLSATAVGPGGMLQLTVSGPSIYAPIPDFYFNVFSAFEAITMTFAVVFQVTTSSSCGPASKSNLWWIILASVLGGVVILAGLASLMIMLVPRLRKTMRPFSKPRQ